jgi:hypothetical protein
LAGLDAGGAGLGITYCHDFDRFYTRRVQVFWKPAGLALAALILSVAVLGAGCSGINTTQGVSPATFLLPGFFGQVHGSEGASPASEPGLPLPESTVSPAAASSVAPVSIAAPDSPPVPSVRLP